MKNELPTILTFFLTMILSVGPFDLSAQTTVTLESVKDNTIYLDPGGTLLSNGSGEHFFAGMSGSGLTHRALIQFDIAGSIPDNAQIESVVLTLNRSRAAPQSDGKSVTLHRLVSNWGEGSSMAPSGEGQGAPPANNDATWEHTFFDGSFWNNEGGDFMASQSASRTMQGSTIQWGSTGGMVQDVQDWLDNPSANFGWILIGDESQTSTSSRFDSKENGIAANRPQLEVTYNMSTAVETPLDRLDGLELLPNYPEPFEEETIIAFRLEKAADIQLVVYDISGRAVKVLADDTYFPGTHRLRWNATNEAGIRLKAGVYFYQLRSGGEVLTQKMVLAR